MNEATVSLALEVALALLLKSQEISALIAKVQSEGRTTLTKEEWAGIESADQAARERLVKAIASKGG